MITAGIDCGKNGAVCIIDRPRNDHPFADVYFYDAPVVRNVTKQKLRSGNYKTRTEYSIKSMVHILSGTLIDVCFIEKAQAMPGQGGVSMFSIGEGYGIWKGILAAGHIPYVVVPPRTWQKYFHIAKPKGAKKKEIKEVGLQVAQTLLKNISARLMTDPFHTPRGRLIDGRVDAFLIAMYGQDYVRETEVR